MDSLEKQLDDLLSVRAKLDRLVERRVHVRPAAPVDVGTAAQQRPQAATATVVRYGHQQRRAALRVQAVGVGALVEELLHLGGAALTPRAELLDQQAVFGLREVAEKVE